MSIQGWRVDIILGVFGALIMIGVAVMTGMYANLQEDIELQRSKSKDDDAEIKGYMIRNTARADELIEDVRERVRLGETALSRLETEIDAVRLIFADYANGHADKHRAMDERMNNAMELMKDHMLPLPSHPPFGGIRPPK